ncbi:MAG: hypothetical protein ACOCUR_01895, partial [Nanoarchaeota archaeon]
MFLLVFSIASFSVSGLYLDVVNFNPSNDTVLSGTGTTMYVDFYVYDDFDSDNLEVELHVANWTGDYSVVDSGTFESNDSSVRRLEYQVNVDGNYSWMVIVYNASLDSNETGIYNFYIDTTNPTYSDVQVVQGDSQNASQYINLSAYLNSTYSYFDTVELEVDNQAVLTETYADFGEIHDALFNWEYLIPNSSAGSTIDLRYCFSDVGSNTDRICTSNMPVYVTDNINPEIHGFEAADQFIKPDDTFDFWVNATDSSSENLLVNISFYDGF